MRRLRSWWRLRRMTPEERAFFEAFAEVELLATREAKRRYAYALAASRRDAGPAA